MCPSNPESLLSCILPVLNPFFPVSFQSWIPSFLYPSSPEFLHSCILPVLNSFFQALNFILFKNLKKKLHNSKKRYKTRLKGAKLEHRVRSSIERYKTRTEVTKFKWKYAKLRTKTTLFVSLNKSKHYFFVFSYFFSFAKWLKLGETVICFVQFCISRIKKNTKLSTLPGPTHSEGRQIIL